MDNNTIFTDEEIRILRRDGVVDINGKRYRACLLCRKVVQVNKRILGSAHFCQ